MDTKQVERAHERLIRDESLLNRTFGVISDAAGAARDGENAADLDSILRRLSFLRRYDEFGRPVTPPAEQLLAAEAALETINGLLAKRRAAEAKIEEVRQLNIRDRASITGCWAPGRFEDMRTAGRVLRQRVEVIEDRLCRPFADDVAGILDDLDAALAAVSATIALTRQQAATALAKAA